MLKWLVFVVLGVIASLAYTVMYVMWFTRGEHATGIGLVRDLTVYSPFFWLLLVILWLIIWWLLRGWLTVAH